MLRPLDFDFHKENYQYSNAILVHLHMNSIRKRFAVLSIRILQRSCSANNLIQHCTECFDFVVSGVYKLDEAWLASSLQRVWIRNLFDLFARVIQDLCRCVYLLIGIFISSICHLEGERLEKTTQIGNKNR